MNNHESLLLKNINESTNENHQCNSSMESTNESLSKNNHQCDSLLKNIDESTNESTNENHQCNSSMESFYTPAMKYVIDNKSEPPEWMRHDPEIVDRFGETMAHRWVQQLHKDSIVENTNETNDENTNDNFINKFPNCEITAEEFTDVPNWMKHDPNKVAFNGSTLARTLEDLWRRILMTILHHGLELMKVNI